MSASTSTDVLIIGAGAAGLMCAIEAGKRGRTVTVIERSNKPGKKILMSGGGRCNFTNYNIEPSRYISHNPHFCKSALSRYTQWDFIKLVEEHQIAYHEKTLGQLFCDTKSKAILTMLLHECDRYHVKMQLNCETFSIQQNKKHLFTVNTSLGDYRCESLVVATGGLSIPTLGTSPFGYQVAEQFGLRVWPTSPGLVPFTYHSEEKQRYEALAGVSVRCDVRVENVCFHENILFTHKGLSGPAILQISSYWKPGDKVTINFLPDMDIDEYLEQCKISWPEKSIKHCLADFLPKRFIAVHLAEELANTSIKHLGRTQIDALIKRLQAWVFKPCGTEGYRTAEVTLGGVDCNMLSSKTMQSNTVHGLFFIGEVVDVTGWLGGYNFQWAWSSGWAAGQVV